MRVKALISFAGKLSMYKGQVAELQDGEVLNDLLSCGYVEEIEEPKPARKKAGKKDESK